jgi:hypothetical protein
MKQQLLPTWTTMIDQIQLAQGSIFMYAGLPVFSEWLIEEGYTRVYYRYIPAYAVYVYFFVIHTYTVTYLLQFVYRVVQKYNAIKLYKACSRRCCSHIPCTV